MNALQVSALRGSVGERFCGNYTYRLRLGENFILFHSATDRSARILPSHVARLLDCCRTFKTLDEHAVRCVKFFSRSSRGAGQPDLDSIKEHLLKLADGGQLISETAILRTCRRSEQQPPKIASVGVITRNRIKSLQRCLRSYIENGKKYGRTNDFVVMDDSEDFKNRAATRDMLSLLKREYDVDISYAGWEEKAGFAQSLVSDDFDPGLVNFALTDADNHEFSCGKNRNALFLHTVGDLIFSTDDDVVCRIAVPPVTEGDLEQEARGQPLTPIEFWFFSGREEALNFAAFVEEDVLANHEQLLGRELTDCLAIFRDISLLSLERPLSYHLRSLQSGHGRVLVTLTGMIGDSGIRLPVTYKVLGRASRERLIEYEQTYLTGCTSREMLRVATRHCLSNRTWFLSTALGYDNRELLPPFFPVLRGTDGIFSDTLRRCFENGYLGDLPRAILHAPSPPRVYDRDVGIRSASRITMDSLIVECILSPQFWSGLTDGVERMRALGKYLMEIGSMSLGDFEEFCLLQLRQSRSRMMAGLEKDLMDYQDLPAFWVRNLKDYLTTMRASLTKPEYVVPHDLLHNRSLNEAREHSRVLVMRFGQLLRNWPDMIEAARRLRARGNRLAAPV